MLRILYVFCKTITGQTIAIILHGGDKTATGNDWYPKNIMLAETRLASITGTEKLTPLRN